MRTIFLLIIAAMILGDAAVCQNCLPEGIQFNQQSLIDNFSTDYPGCSCIVGNVEIYDPSGNKVSNLEGLEDVTSIGGTLSIGFNNYLDDLSGLENLDSIGGNLEIKGNNDLTDLSALHGLTYISGNLRIFGNGSLTSLTGLDGFTAIGGNLDITWTNLANLEGLKKLRSVGGSLFLASNLSLVNLQGLDSLRIIGGMIEMTGNDALINLKGLNNLESINGDLWIHHNDALSSIIALSHLTSTGGGGVSIHDNDALTSLTGIDNISAGTVSDFYIVDNPLLNKCEVKSLCEFLSTPGAPVSITGNAYDCRSSFIVGVACMNDVEDDDQGLIPIRITPNPVSSLLTVEFPDKFKPGRNSLSLIDCNGRVLSELSVQEQTTFIDMSGLSKGIYILKVENDKSLNSYKLIKQ